MQIKIIVAIANNNVIGDKNNRIPWEFHPQDMKIFATKTKSEGATVVMGRKTFESLPSKYKPLPNRRNIVLTNDQNWKYDGVEAFNNIDELLESLKDNINVKSDIISPREIKSLWVCGGAKVYEQFMDMADELHISHFDVNPETSIDLSLEPTDLNHAVYVMFPKIDYNIWEEIKSDKYDINNNSPSFAHKVYKRTN